MTTLLSLACNKLNVELIKFSLELGANPNTKKEQYCLFQILNNKIDFLKGNALGKIEKLLREHGVYSKRENKEFYNLFYKKEDFSHLEFSKEFQKISTDPQLIQNIEERRNAFEILELLILHGLDINGCIDMVSDTNVARILFKNGANDDPYDLLYDQVRYENREFVEFLLEEVIPITDIEGDLDNAINLVFDTYDERSKIRRYFAPNFIQFFAKHNRENLCWFLRIASQNGCYSDVKDFLENDTLSEDEYIDMLGDYLEDYHCVCEIYGYASGCDVCDEGHDFECCHCSGREIYLATRILILSGLSKDAIKSRILIHGHLYKYKIFILDSIKVFCGSLEELAKRDELEIFKLVVRHELISRKRLETVHSKAGENVKKFIDDYTESMKRLFDE